MGLGKEAPSSVTDRLLPMGHIKSTTEKDEDHQER